MSDAKKVGSPIDPADVVAFNRVVDSAILWWKSKRPKGWRKAKHLRHPTVNVLNCADRDLANAVAEIQKRGWS